MKKLFLISILFLGFAFASPVFAETFQTNAGLFGGYSSRNVTSEWGETWAFVRDGDWGSDYSGTGISNPVKTIHQIENTFDAWEIQRSWLYFDTSSIPDEVIITSVEIDLYKQAGSANSPYETDLQFTTATVPDGQIMSGSDFANGNGNPAVSVGQDFCSLATSTNGYKTFVISDFSAINKTGNSNFRLATQADIENNEPTAEAHCFMDFSGWSMPNPPKITINYEYPPPPPPTYLSLSTASSSEMLGALGSLFSDLWPLIAIMAGIPLAFYVLTKVQKMTLIKEKAKKTGVK